MFTAQGTPIVQIGFFKSQSAFWGQKYDHVELRFSDGTVTSITRNPGRVHYTSGRQLSNPLYSCFFQIAIDSEKESHVQIMAQNAAHDDTVRFSYAAMIWNFLPIGSCYPMQGTFCSQYVTSLLKEMDMCKDLNPLTTSPDILFDNLKRDPRAIVSFNKCLYSFGV